MLDGRGVDTAVCQKKKGNRNRLHLDSKNNRSWPQRTISLCEVLIIVIIMLIEEEPDKLSSEVYF